MEEKIYYSSNTFTYIMTNKKLLLKYLKSKRFEYKKLN